MPAREVAGMPKALSPEVAELLRWLNHARACDGIRCSTCNAIDQRLLDAPHATEDPEARLLACEHALLQCAQVVERVWCALEGAPVPASTRRATAQLAEWIEKARSLLRMPVTVDGRPPAPVLRPTPDLPAEEAPAAPARPVAPVAVQVTRLTVVRKLPPAQAPTWPRPRPVRQPVLAPVTTLTMMAEFLDNPDD